ncbi:MAG TPA: hypothetical protein VNN72_24955, partial [Polyangiaceae bacterium]|nr:hypothetical protein [Polyangiaceae bacterium]
MSRALLLLVGVLLVALGCEGDLSDNLDGKACGAKGECVDGYVCDTATNVCVKAGSVPAGCRAYEIECDGVCVSLETNANHCGGCGAACTAPENGVPACVNSSCKLACADGFAPCGETCVDLTSDAASCGACGRACPMPDNGSPLCEDGTCAHICDADYDDCDGVCVDTTSDPDHCGGCDTACASAQVCDRGTCGGSCSGGLLACNGACIDVDTS